jgi:cytochrome b
MHANPSMTSNPGSNSSPTPPSRRVVDAPIRAFHWLFALCFVGAYLTADFESWRLMHVTLGYTLAGLLVFRVLYGLMGPRHARLSLMLRKLKAGPQWLKSLREHVRSGSYASINWQQGQNLGMGLAVVALLMLVIPLTLSGYATFNDWGDFLGGDWMEEVHELLGNTYLTLVLVHLALIAGLSVLRNKNVAQPMLTGRLPGPGPDLAKRNHVWLAALLLLGVLAYWTWEWQQPPKGGMMKETISWST